MTRRENRTIPEGTEHLSKAAIFAEVARTGSFTAAARGLGLARSTVSDHVRALEEALGVQLLERSTRKVSLTEEGALLLEHVDRALSVWGDALSLLATRREAPTGTLRVTAPMGLASLLVAPALSRMMREHPAVSCELRTTDRVLDMIGDGVDVAIRMAHLDDSRLIACKLGETPMCVVAAPECARALAGAGLEALAEQPWVTHAAMPSSEVHVWPEDAPQTPNHRVRLRIKVRAATSTSEGQVGLLVGGLGLALVPRLLVDTQLRQGALEVIPGWRGRPRPIYAIYPAQRLLPPRTRSFLDALTEHIRAHGLLV